MAIAITITDTNAHTLAAASLPHWYAAGYITYSSTYATNGDAFTAALMTTAINSAMSSDITITTIDSCFFEPDSTYTYGAFFDSLNSKVESVLLGVATTANEHAHRGASRFCIERNLIRPTYSSS